MISAFTCNQCANYKYACRTICKTADDVDAVAGSTESRIYTHFVARKALGHAAVEIYQGPALETVPLIGAKFGRSRLIHEVYRAS